MKCPTAAVMCFLLTLCLSVVGEEAKLTFQGEPLPTEVIEKTRSNLERFFSRLASEGPSDRLQIRSIFGNALLLAELNGDLGMLDKAFEIAEAMQDLDPESRTFGNFKWYWFNEEVGDRNAVEFSMQVAILLYRFHRDELPDAIRQRLERMMRNSIQGILNHGVSESYTNIFIMKTWNLIGLGEVLSLPEIAEQGYEHLDRFVIYTAENGIHEYLSPTYYGTDLDSLGLIARFAGRQRGREQARGVLNLFWNDIAASWFEPAGRLGGAHSRDYNYLFGHGYLDTHLRVQGWMPPRERFSLGGMILAMIGKFEVNPSLRESSLKNVPRFVQQSWGEYWYDTATNYVTEKYALGTAGANYGPMDKPLVVLFADPELVGAYYLMDARRDPYGRTKFPQGRSGHSKALHLRPFLMSVQDKNEALLLTSTDVERYWPESDYVASHLVLPAAVESCFIGERKIDTTGQFSQAVKLGEPIFLQHRGAALGVKVLAARAMDGSPGQISLARDAPDDKAMRLTVLHYSGEVRKVEPSKALVVLLVRMDAVNDVAEFREAFTSAKSGCEERDGVVRVSAQGTRAVLSLEADLATLRRIDATVNGQRPKEFLLAVNGDDVGRAIMDKIPPVEDFRRAFDGAKITIAPGAPCYIEAESAPLIVKPMVVSEDADASGGKFIWMPGEVGGKGGSRIGQAVWPLRVNKAGVYYLWGRVLTPTPSDDSFFVRIQGKDGEVFPRTDWHTGTHQEWAWVRVTFKDQPENWLKLPEGNVRLEFRVREDGSRLDKLFITDSPDVQP